MSAESDFLRSIIEFMNDDPLTVYYIQYLQGTYDPATSEYTTTTVETPCRGLQLDLTRNMNGLSSVFGKEALAGDKELYMLPPEKATLGATPLQIDTTSDRVRIGSITYKVEGMQSTDPSAANVILYRFMLRRQN